MRLDYDDLPGLQHSDSDDLENVLTGARVHVSPYTERPLDFHPLKDLAIDAAADQPLVQIFNISSEDSYVVDARGVLRSGAEKGLARARGPLQPTIATAVFAAQQCWLTKPRGLEGLSKQSMAGDDVLRGPIINAWDDAAQLVEGFIQDNKGLAFASSFRGVFDHNHNEFIQQDGDREDFPTLPVGVAAYRDKASKASRVDSYRSINIASKQFRLPLAELGFYQDGEFNIGHALHAVITSQAPLIIIDGRVDVLQAQFTFFSYLAEAAPHLFTHPIAFFKVNDATGKVYACQFREVICKHGRYYELCEESEQQLVTTSKEFLEELLIDMSQISSTGEHDAIRALCGLFFYSKAGAFYRDHKRQQQLSVIQPIADDYAYVVPKPQREARWVTSMAAFFRYYEASLQMTDPGVRIAVCMTAFQQAVTDLNLFAIGGEPTAGAGFDAMLLAATYPAMLMRECQLKDPLVEDLSITNSLVQWISCFQERRPSLTDKQPWGPYLTTKLDAYLSTVLDRQAMMLHSEKIAPEAFFVLKRWDILQRKMAAPGLDEVEDSTVIEMTSLLDNSVTHPDALLADAAWPVGIVERRHAGDAHIVEGHVASMAKQLGGCECKWVFPHLVDYLSPQNYREEHRQVVDSVEQITHIPLNITGLLESSLKKVNVQSCGKTVLKKLDMDHEQVLKATFFAYIYSKSYWCQIVGGHTIERDDLMRFDVPNHPGLIQAGQALLYLKDFLLSNDKTYKKQIIKKWKRLINLEGRHQTERAQVYFIYTCVTYALGPYTIVTLPLEHYKKEIFAKALALFNAHMRIKASYQLDDINCWLPRDMYATTLYECAEVLSNVECFYYEDSSMRQMIESLRVGLASDFDDAVDRVAHTRASRAGSLPEEMLSAAVAHTLYSQVAVKHLQNTYIAAVLLELGQYLERKPVLHDHKYDVSDELLLMVAQNWVQAAEELFDANQPGASDQSLWRRQEVFDKWMMLYICLEGMRTDSYCFPESSARPTAHNTPIRPSIEQKQADRDELESGHESFTEDEYGQRRVTEADVEITLYDRFDSSSEDSDDEGGYDRGAEESEKTEAANAYVTPVRTPVDSDAEAEHSGSSVSYEPEHAEEYDKSIAPLWRRVMHVFSKEEVTKFVYTLKDFLVKRKSQVNQQQRYLLDVTLEQLCDYISNDFEMAPQVREKELRSVVPPTIVLPDEESYALTPRLPEIKQTYREVTFAKFLEYLAARSNDSLEQSMRKRQIGFRIVSGGLCIAQFVLIHQEAPLFADYNASFANLTGLIVEDVARMRIMIGAFSTVGVALAFEHVLQFSRRVAFMRNKHYRQSISILTVAQWVAEFALAIYYLNSMSKDSLLFRSMLTLGLAQLGVPLCSNPKKLAYLLSELLLPIFELPFKAVQELYFQCAHSRFFKFEARNKARVTLKYVLGRLFSATIFSLAMFGAVSCSGKALSLLAGSYLKTIGEASAEKIEILIFDLFGMTGSLLAPAILYKESQKRATLSALLYGLWAVVGVLSLVLFGAIVSHMIFTFATSIPEWFEEFEPHMLALGMSTGVLGAALGASESAVTAGRRAGDNMNALYPPVYRGLCQCSRRSRRAGLLSKAVTDGAEQVTDPLSSSQASIWSSQPVPKVVGSTSQSSHVMLEMGGDDELDDYKSLDQQAAVKQVQ